MPKLFRHPAAARTDSGSRGSILHPYPVPYTAVRHEYPSFKKTCFAKFRHLKKRVVTLNNVYALKKRVGFPRHESLYSYFHYVSMFSLIHIQFKYYHIVFRYLNNC